MANSMIYALIAVIVGLIAAVIAISLNLGDGYALPAIVGMVAGGIAAFWYNRGRISSLRK